MKRTPTTLDLTALPEEIRALASGAKIYDSSCSPAARVYFIDRDGGYFLKQASEGTLKKEAEMTSYFHRLGLGAETLGYYSFAEGDLLLTRRVPGEDCTSRVYLDDPKRLCDLLAESLRSLHERDTAGCPIRDRMKDYIALATENYHTGRYDSYHFPDSFGYRSAEEAWSVFSEGCGALRSEVLIHGDYCLPNVMLDGWRLSGFIDLGCGGVGNRHVDLFWGCWSLEFNLGCDRYRERFLDAYGRDKIDTDILRIVAAAEVFG